MIPLMPARRVMAWTAASVSGLEMDAVSIMDLGNRRGCHRRDTREKTGKSKDTHDE
jgi:hypothetical protein